MKYILLVPLALLLPACFTTTKTNLDGQTTTYTNDPFVFGSSEKCVQKDGSYCQPTSKFQKEFEDPSWSQRGDDTRAPVKARSK